MTELRQVYKCEKCGNIVEVLHPGDGELVCCGQPMKLMKEGSTDGALEKHVPVIEPWKSGYHVKVGSAPHPMEQKHYIEWIELVTPEGSFIRFLNPEDKAEAFFEGVTHPDVTARAYCNLHGIWKSQK